MLLNYGMILVTNISIVSYSTEKKIESIKIVEYER